MSHTLKYAISSDACWYTVGFTLVAPDAAEGPLGVRLRGELMTAPVEHLVPEVGRREGMHFAQGWEPGNNIVHRSVEGETLRSTGSMI